MPIFKLLYRYFRISETSMSSNTRTKIQKIDNVHVTNLIWNNRNATIKELPDFLKEQFYFNYHIKIYRKEPFFQSQLVSNVILSSLMKMPKSTEETGGQKVP